MSALSRAQYAQIINENRGKYAYNADALSVAQLCDFVKSYDETYNPKEVKVHEKKKVVHNLCTTYLHSASFLTNSFIWLATFVTSWRNSAAVIRKTPE